MHPHTWWEGAFFLRVGRVTLKWMVFFCFPSGCEVYCRAIDALTQGKGSILVELTLVLHNSLRQPSSPTFTTTNWLTTSQSEAASSYVLTSPKLWSKLKLFSINDDAQGCYSNSHNRQLPGRAFSRQCSMQVTDKETYVTTPNCPLLQMPKDLWAWPPRRSHRKDRVAFALIQCPYDYIKHLKIQWILR